MATDDIFTSFTGSAFFQIAPGKEPEYIGKCFDADALPDPQGDRDPVQCYDENGRWVTVGITKTAPDKITTVLTGLQQKGRTVAEQYKERACPFVFYGMQQECGRRGVFDSGDKIYAMMDTTITDNPIADWMMRDTDNPTTTAYNLTGMPGRIDMRNLVAQVMTSDSDQDMRSLAVRDSRCASACGDIIKPGDEVIFGGTGAVAATPDVQETTNGGDPADVANFPFAVDENVEALVRFQVDASTERWVAFRESDGVSSECAYTDDGAATAWNDVTVVAAAEGAQGPKAAFALDYEHIWFVTDGGNIYFSSDGCETWTAQFTAGTSLYAVHFINARFGFAVGAADEMYKTEDGGVTWETLSGTGGGGDLLCVQVFSTSRVAVSTDDGDFWYSWDGGANFTQLIDFGTGSVPAFHFWSDARGVAIFNTAAPVATIYQTSNGGYSWLDLTTPTNQGLSDCEMGSNNIAWFAGKVGAGGVALPMKAVG